MNEELKPCPFCGGTKIKIELEGWYYRAVCMNLCGMVGGRYLTKEQATAGWNIRPLEYDLRARAERAEAERDAAREEAARLREALEQARGVLGDINNWCGASEGYHALPFEPPWYAKLLAALTPAGEEAQE